MKHNFRIFKPKLWRVAANALAVWVFLACANVVSPTGGPRDEDPPLIIRSTPPNYSPNYSGEPIRIYFDEYITLSNLRQQLLISPPMEEIPDIRVRGKSIQIEIKDSLRPNTTYNIFFGDAIRDVNEGNAIPNFQFVFSTGDYVDSLSLRGRVIDAFTLNAMEGVSIMLYDSIYDSIPYKERPVYFSKTNKEGDFFVSNMRENSYLIFGLLDNNANFLYDLPDEKIAFLDSLVTPRFNALIDTTDLDIPESTDRSGPDTPEEEIPFVETEMTDPGEESVYTLYLFQEADTLQRVTSSSVIRKGQLVFSFRVPFDSVCARDLSGTLPDEFYIPEFGKDRDTLTMWLPAAAQDTLWLELFDGIHSLDTIRIATLPRTGRGRTASDSETLPPLSLSHGARGSRPLPYFQAFTLKASAPIETIDQEKISLIMQDSIPVSVSFHFRDHVKRTLFMHPEPEESREYQLEIMPGAFTDIFGVQNDTLTLAFKTSSTDDYGMLIMNISIAEPDNGILTSEKNYVLQLLDTGGAAIQEKYIDGSGTYRFGNLTPGNYSFKLIEDRNKNKKWDPGHYLRKIFPERVFLYEEPLQVRQNWELEMSWEIEIKHLTLQGI